MNELKIGVKLKLSALWVTMMLLYIYADILSLFRPGQITENERRTHGAFASHSNIVVSRLIIDDHSGCDGFPVLNIEA